MPLPVDPNHKFACIAVNGPSLADALPDPFQIAPRLWALKQAPIDIDDWWGEGLGTWALQRYRDCGLFLVATRPSGRPEILDDENMQLEKRLYALLHALLVHEAVRSYYGHVMTGARIRDGAPNIRQHSLIPASPPHRLAPLQTVGAAVLTDAHATSLRLLHLYGEDPFQAPDPLAALTVQAHGRVRRGLNVLLEGLRARYLNPRLHHCERALEAITHPPIRKTKKKFVSRCTVFAGGSLETRNILKDIYELRCAEEHLNEWEPAIGSPPAAEEIASLRAYQAEVLACFVYRRLLDQPTLLARFETDASTDAFWDEHTTRVQAWGATVDITKAGLVATGRLDDE